MGCTLGFRGGNPSKGAREEIPNTKPPPQQAKCTGVFVFLDRAFLILSSVPRSIGFSTEIHCEGGREIF